ncbi:MAG: hypothetical protein EPN93_11880 [Spirochaetes bacterium]|nr:MAG: hypothetical protein EPN93_11880 [Spirochaetota bacterium]
MKRLLKVPIIVFSFLLFSCGQSTLTSDIESRFNDEYHKVPPSAPWAVKIDNRYTLTRAQVDREREFLIKWLSDPVEREKNLSDKGLAALYLDNILNQTLIIHKAIEDGTFKSPEFDMFIWVSIRDAIVKYYLKKQLEEHNSESLWAPVANAEIEEVYKKNVEIYSKMGLSRKQALAEIRTSLSNERNALAMKKLESDLVNELKLKLKIEFSK